MTIFQAVVFDFDGLIIDSESSDYLSWKAIYELYDCELPLDLWTAHIGSTAFDPFDYLQTRVGRLDWETVEQVRKKKDDEWVAQLPILPGVQTYLAQARQLGLKIGLASSSPHSWVDAHLQRLGLFEWFEVISCRDDVNGRSKPDPAVYLAACARLGVAPSHALALEDSPNGAWAAKRAGLWCVAIPGPMTQQLNFAHADYTLSSLAEMPLETLMRRLKKWNLSI